MLTQNTLDIIKLIRYGVFVVLGLASTVLSGQQTAQSSLFMMDKYQFNPAYGGLDYSLVINAYTRSQWQGLDHNPKLVGVNAHLPYYVWNGALGMRATSRSLGVLSHNEVSFSYNYVLNLGSGLWSNGARVGLSHLGVDGAAIVTPEGIYTGGSVNHNDPILLPTSGSGIGLLYEVGSYYKSRRLEAGLSLTALPGNNIPQDGFVFDKDIHVYAYGQYRFSLFDEFDLLQSILLKTDFGEVQTEVSSIVQINGNIFGGIGVRGYSSSSLDAVIVILGVRITDKITLTYGYDAGVSGLRRVNEGSHELLFSYNLQKVIGTGLPPKIIYNPRYL